MASSLVADYSSSNNESDSDSVSDTSSEQAEANNYINENLPGNNKLPLPDFATSGGLALTHSVFSNPFTEAERAKRAILEKHVKMTPTKDDTKMINGKKICWNFRKGRCRFGHNCKFAHDSDLHNSETCVNSQGDNLPFDDPLVNQVISSSISDAQENNGDEEDIPAQIKSDKRKRCGLSQGLVPGKKVMKMYKKLSHNPSAVLKQKR